MRKICVVTGSRADYGLLYWLMKDIQADRDCQLQLAVTGMHLEPEFGLTFQAIESDGFRIDARIDTLQSDTPAGIAKSIGLGVTGFGAAFGTLRPDLVVLPGDRFEIFAAAQAALVAKIPVAHIAGGDTTEGAYDEAIRHSITKMSHLHFVTNEDAARRVIQLGENPDHVFNVGSPGIDSIKRAKLLDRSELEQQLGLRFRRRNLLITFHPPTLDAEPAGAQFQALLTALDGLPAEQFSLIFTKSNADTGGRELNRMVDDYVATRSHARGFASLGQQRYLSLMAQVDAIVGNSSSGVYEAPSFRKPTVNIGDRQKGRLMADSVINCDPETSAISSAIRTALTKNCSNTVNPYGDGESSRRILATIKRFDDPPALIKKHFFDAASSDGR
ncbi:MAG: UDP-N-acetylglucosamine 2-epimerase (hydrolyzing) [Betaproteobacteria bacterium]|nr:UDP-N-acetylglucosamine 2-epimerase (hydrolyzing) [Betaproteobacteria bacterium]